MADEESPTKTRTLRKAPSLVLNAPPAVSVNAQPEYAPRKLGKPGWTSSTDAVPDSEEENIYIPSKNVDRTDRKGVIVISSDEEDVSRLAKFTSPIGDDLSRGPKKPKRVVRRIVQSSDESEDDPRENPTTEEPEVIEISDDGGEAVSRIPQVSGLSNSRVPQVAVSADGSVMTWDVPVSPRKPLRTPSNGNAAVGPSTPCRSKEFPGLKASVDTTASPAPKNPRPRPNTKKAQAEAELKRLAEFTQILFNDLNRDVFSSRLPADVELCWSKRLNTTAGRATYARKDGVVSGKIELATKILDCEERVMKTLSHEMCHLACWIINKKLNENHGPLFKAWAARVAAKRPDIEVSTTHDYEISYKFEWKCEKCELVYGRHSKSIKPDDVCGRCHEGQLIPLFTQRQRRAPQTPKISRMASSKPRDSPLRIQPGMSDALKEDMIDLTICSVDSDEEGAAAESDSEVEVLATLLGSATIAGPSS